MLKEKAPFNSCNKYTLFFFCKQAHLRQEYKYLLVAKYINTSYHEQVITNKRISAVISLINATL